MVKKVPIFNSECGKFLSLLHSENVISLYLQDAVYRREEAYPVKTPFYDNYNSYTGTGYMQTPPPPPPPTGRMK